MSEQRDVGNLEALARAVDAGADRLRYHLDRFEGGEVEQEDGSLVMVEGIRAMYEEAVENAAEAIFTAYEDAEKRPPPEAVRLARARQKVDAEHPDLAKDYRDLSASIAKGEKWLIQKRAAISALQTLAKTGAQLAGTR